MTVITDHSAVRTVLGAPSSSGKHARWWLKVFGSGVKDVQIVYRPGRDNDGADALSQNPVTTQQDNYLEVGAQVAQVTRASEEDVSHLLQQEPGVDVVASDFHLEFCKNCPDCAVVSGTGRKHVPPLHPISVQRPFQMFGVDIMELPITEKGSRYVIVFQDFSTKWPLVFPAPDQKAIRIAGLVAEEVHVVPIFGVPESLLSDCGTNLLANVMMDVCSLLGITKLNSTAYHPQCNGMVERMNRTLKAMLRKHAVKFGPQWDKYLPGVLWAYRIALHETTKEKPSFLMFGLDLRSPTEAALLPTDPLEPSDV